MANSRARYRLLLFVLFDTCVVPGVILQTGGMTWPERDLAATRLAGP